MFSHCIKKAYFFYKSYNEDAMVFVEHVKGYKVVSKFMKNYENN